MRIAYYCRALTLSGGGGIHARSLVQAWRQDGHEVLCLPRDPGEHVEPARRRGRLSERLPVRTRIFGSLLKARLTVLRELRPLKSALGRFGPDLLVVRRNVYENVLDRLLAEVLCAYVAEVNAVNWQERSDLSGLSTPVGVVAAENRFLQHAIRCACVSAEVARHVAQLGIPESRIVLVPNGVDTVLFCPDAPHPAGADGAVAGHSPLFGFVGVVGPSHDMSTMARAAEQVLNVSPSAGFLFVGSDLQRLKDCGFSQAVLERTTASGPVGHADVPGWLALADVLWAAKWLRNQPVANGQPVRLHGVGYGALLALMAGAVDRDIAAVVEEQPLT
ncbi:MAG: glycosyltransferase family 4 protein, partial [Armatimonadota bacterium]